MVSTKLLHVSFKYVHSTKGINKLIVRCKGNIPMHSKLTATLLENDDGPLTYIDEVKLNYQVSQLS